MEQEDRKEQNSAFSDFLGALGFSGGKKPPPEGKTTGQGTPESAAETPEYPPPEDAAKAPEPPPEPESEEPTEPENAPRWVIAEPIRKTKTHRKAIIAAVALIAIGCALWYFRPLLTEPKPPGEDAVAAFNNRYITVSDLKDFIVLESGGQEDIEITSLEQYRQIIRIMAVEQIVQARAAQKGIEDRDEVRHNLQDLISDASIDTLVHQITQRELSEEAIPKYEVQQYYDNNRRQYGEKNFSDAEHEIREILVRAKEQDFFPQYIEELKRATGLEVNFALLDTLGTSDESMAEAVSLRGDEALFNVHGRRYTLKNFYTEFRELPAMYQERFSNYEARRQLLEQFIAKELLLEETGDTSENAVEQHSLEELKAQYLTQLLHQEKVEARITEPEEAEIQRYYEKNKKNFVIPARVRISLIGISEGKDGETDEGYLARVLAALRNPARYGKGGDFAAWALDSSPKVSAAWEFKNFSVFGALLVQVISGNQTDGVSPVGNLEAVKSYLNEYAPPVLFEVGTPEIINLNPAVALQPLEDSVYNRGETERRLKTYLQFAAKPGCIVTAGALRLAVIDGVDITEAAIKLNGDTAGLVKTTVLEYPVLGEVTWE